jgi:hypothetical protein
MSASVIAGAVSVSFGYVHPGADGRSDGVVRVRRAVVRTWWDLEDRVWTSYAGVCQVDQIAIVEESP